MRATTSMKASLPLCLGVLASFLAVGSALFSAFETALFSLQPQELERLRRNKTRYSEALSRLLSNPKRLLSVILLADVCINIPLILLCQYLLPREDLPATSFWLRTLLLLGLVVFLCDLLPKLAALSNPYRLIRPAVKILLPLMRLFERPAASLQRLSDRFAELLTPEPPNGNNCLNDEEMETLVELGAEDGALHPSESAIIQEIIRLGNKTVRDCMTPRVDAVCLADDLPIDELLAQLRKSRYRRVPVYHQTPDNIIGILEVRNFLEFPGTHYTEVLTPPSFVPESMNALTLLRSFLRLPQAIAIVVDEHGGTEGIVTRADLVEEVLADALPGAERDLYIEALGQGMLVASGNARLEDIAQTLETPISAEGIGTIGGLAFMLGGQLPKPGTTLHSDTIRITIRRTSRKRIEEVLVERTNGILTPGGER
jgi:CBS domain containing-hemolysin-like protein